MLPQEVFSVHGSDASFIAQEYFRTLAAVTNIGPQQLATVDLKQEKYEEVSNATTSVVLLSLLSYIFSLSLSHTHR